MRKSSTWLRKESEDGNHFSIFEKITGHQTAKLDGKQTTEVEVLWDTGDKTWEPLNMMKDEMGQQISQEPKEVFSILQTDMFSKEKDGTNR